MRGLVRHLDRRLALAICALALASAGSAAEHIVTIDAMQFSPATLTVRSGDQVQWLNKDLVPHTATARPGFDSGSIAPGQAWRWMAAKRGHYAYACTLHPTMKALLVVE